MTSRKYKLLLTRSQRWSLYLPAAMFILMPIFFLVKFRTMPDISASDGVTPPYFPWFPLGIFVLFGMAWLSTVLSLPRTISITTDGKMVFSSPIRTVEVRAAEILSVEPASLWWAQVPLTVYLMKHHGGKLRFAGQFTGQHQLFSELAQSNPNVELKGC